MQLYVANRSALHHLLYKTTLTGVLLRFGDGVPRVLTERPSYNRSPAQDSFSVPSKNEKYDTLQNDYLLRKLKLFCTRSDAGYIVVIHHWGIEDNVHHFLEPIMGL